MKELKVSTRVVVSSVSRGRQLRKRLRSDNLAMEFLHGCQKVKTRRPVLSEVELLKKKISPPSHHPRAGIEVIESYSSHDPLRSSSTPISPAPCVR